jgi:hypothetical protein
MVALTGGALLFFFVLCAAALDSYAFNRKVKYFNKFQAASSS